MWYFAIILVGAQLCVALPRQQQQQEVELLESTRVNCKVTAVVTYPSTPGEDAVPTVDCTTKCALKTKEKDQTYFVGYVYRHFERLEKEYGLMLQIRYNKGAKGDDSCVLVPAIDNEEVLSTHLEGNSPCVMTTVPSTTLATTLPPTTVPTTLPRHSEPWTTVPTTVPITHDFITTLGTTLPPTTVITLPPTTVPTTFPHISCNTLPPTTTVPPTPIPTTTPIIQTTLPTTLLPTTVHTSVPITHDHITTTRPTTIPPTTLPNTHSTGRYVPTTTIIPTTTTTSSIPITHDAILTTLSTTLPPTTVPTTIPYHTEPWTTVSTTVAVTDHFVTTTLPPTTEPTTHSTGRYIPTTTTKPTTTTTSTTTTPTTTTSWVCGSDWVLIGTACFHISEVRGDWREGQDYCTELGATLASVRSQEEQDGLAGLIDDNAWIGLHDMHSEGDHLWEDQTALSYSNWEPGQPDNSGTFLWWGSGEDCVEMNLGYSLRWNDQDCDNENIFICRREAELQG